MSDKKMSTWFFSALLSMGGFVFFGFFISLSGLFYSHGSGNADMGRYTLFGVCAFVCVVMMLAVLPVASKQDLLLKQLKIDEGPIRAAAVSAIPLAAIWAGLPVWLCIAALYLCIKYVGRSFYTDIRKLDEKAFDSTVSTIAICLSVVYAIFGKFLFYSDDHPAGSGFWWFRDGSIMIFIQFLIAGVLIAVGFYLVNAISKVADWKKNCDQDLIATLAAKGMQPTHGLVSALRTEMGPAFFKRRADEVGLDVDFAIGLQDNGSAKALAHLAALVALLFLMFGGAGTYSIVVLPVMYAAGCVSKKYNVEFAPSNVRSGLAVDTTTYK